MARHGSQDQAGDLARLPKLLARLESDQDAEVLAAARAASRLVRVAGLSWDEVILQAPAKGWRSLIDLGRQLAAETRRRVAAERAAHHWQTLARLRQDAVNRPAPEPTPEAAAPLPPAHSPAEPAAAAVVEVETGHPLIDGLLASPALDATQRIRVEAIASWYRRSGDLLDVECQDLEHFGRMAGLIPSFGDQRVAA
ncbi:MAG: hypothetical protein ACOVQ8_08535 [Elstera sp.]